MVPFAAVRDALDRFDADLIVISTHPVTRSRWLRKDLVEHVRKAIRRPGRPHRLARPQQPSAER